MLASFDRGFRIPWMFRMERSDRFRSPPDAVERFIESLGARFDVSSRDPLGMVSIHVKEAPNLYSAGISPEEYANSLTIMLIYSAISHGVDLKVVS